MTRRDDFAKAALTGLLASDPEAVNRMRQGHGYDLPMAAQLCAEVADALIAELDRTKEKGMGNDDAQEMVGIRESRSVDVASVGRAGGPVCSGVVAADPLTITALRDGQEVVGRLEWSKETDPPHARIVFQDGNRCILSPNCPSYDELDDGWTWRHCTVPDRKERAKVRAFVEAGPPKDSGHSGAAKDVSPLPPDATQASRQPVPPVPENADSAVLPEAHSGSPEGEPEEDDSETCQQCGGIGTVEDFDADEPSEVTCATCGGSGAAPSPPAEPVPACCSECADGWAYEDSDDDDGHPCNCPRGQQVALNWDLDQLRRIFRDRTPEQVVGAMSDEVRSAIVHALYAKAFPNWDQSDGVAEELALSLIDQRDQALARAESLRDRLATIIDEAFGPRPVMTADELLTTLEQQLHESHRNHEGAIEREQAIREREEARELIEALIDAGKDLREVTREHEWPRACRAWDSALGLAATLLPPETTDTPEQIAAQVHAEFLGAKAETERVAARLDAAAEGKLVPPHVFRHKCDKCEGHVFDQGGEVVPEPPRPSYVPASVPWAYVTDGLGRKVGAWVSHGGTAVCIDDPDGGHWTYNERLAPTFNGQAYRKLTPALASQCAALLRGEIGWGHG